MNECLSVMSCISAGYFKDCWMCESWIASNVEWKFSVILVGSEESNALRTIEILWIGKKRLYTCAMYLWKMENWTWSKLCRRLY